MTRIEAHGIERWFPHPAGRRRALAGVDLRVEPGEFVVLLGPSGCGKTTLLNILSGLDAPDAGRVEMRSSDGRAPVLSHMFQESRLLPWMTVRENLAFVLDGAARRDRARVDDWLGRVGLPATGDLYPRQLSVGMQQRVAVARALIIEPDVLFMDEPFSALDELTAMTMREELLELWRDLGVTVVMVTHNPMEAVLLADRVLVMTPGPGRIRSVLDLTRYLERPRDPDSEELWRVSREAVRSLGGAGVPRGPD